VSLDILYGTDAWIIQVVFLSLMVAGVEAGFRFGRRMAEKTGEMVKPQISVVEGSLVGVLGLLLAFTMSMAVTRFEVRKQLVLDDANAIGTSYRRTKLLPEPEASQIANLLRQYVDVRVRYVLVGEDPVKLQAAREQAARLQTEFWARAVAYGQKDPNPVRAGLLLQSLNQVIDLDAARWMALHNHVPSAVIYLNAILALLTITLVGYAFGLHGVHHVFSMFLMALAFTVVLSVIIDLDRPRHGFIQVSQQPMIDLQRELHSQSSSLGN
jgi:hypothetical protein